MVILYEVHNGLYVNMTNKCPCACVFCLRQTKEEMEGSGSLWLKREPTVDEVISEFSKFDMSQYEEVVFCGFGEPTCALPVLLEAAAWLKANDAPPIRVNTNGHGNLIAGRDISKELASCVDTVSISLNHPDQSKYQALVRSRFGDEAFPAMLDFAKRCAEAGIHVIMTTVDTTITHEEEDRCRTICRELGAEYRIRPWAE